jgi:hypothetical protein
MKMYVILTKYLFNVDGVTFPSEGATCQPKHLDEHSEQYVFQIQYISVLLCWYEHEIYWLVHTQIAPMHAVCSVSILLMLVHAHTIFIIIGGAFNSNLYYDNSMPMQQL